MKRRRPNSNKVTQSKISRFFSSTTPSASGLSKDVQVAVPCSIDSLENVKKANEFTNNNAREILEKFISKQSDENEAKIEESPVVLSSVRIRETVQDDKTASNLLLDARKNKLKLTPLEQQVVSLKEDNPELLLIVQCGYKYKMFGEDADTASQILNMVAYLNHNFLTCSFPTHRLLIHVKKLISHNHKVGIVNQKETTALKAASETKHTPFKRELSMVYTKATFIDELDDSIITNQNLDIPLCITFICESYSKSDGAIQIGIITCFTQNSDIVYDHFEDSVSRNGLDNRLTHWQPSEIVLPEKDVSSKTLNFAQQFSSYKLINGDCVRIEFASSTDWSTSSTILTQIYSDDQEMISILKDLPPIIICCLSMAYHYLQQFKMEQLVNNLKTMKMYSGTDDFLHLDGNAVRNLNLVPLIDGGGHQAEGSLFGVLNRTRTKFGTRLLRSWILKPLTSRDEILARHETLDWFVQHHYDEELKTLKKSLTDLPDLEKQLTAVLHARLRPSEFYSLCLSWLQLRKISVQFRSHYEHLPPYLSSLVDVVIQSLDGVMSFLEQINASAIKSDDKTQLFNDLSQYPQMAAIVNQIQQVKSELQAVKPSICKALGLLAMSYVTVAGNEYLIEVKNAMLRSVPSTWIKISATKQCARFRSPDVSRLFTELSRLRELLKEAADQAWVQLLAKVASSYLTFKKANSAVGTIDVLLAFAEIAKSENYSKPTIVEGAGILDITGGRHPVLSRLIRNSMTEYVPNDTHLNIDNQRCMILTGPNMGGKSCYLSQVAIIVVLAQMGSYVPATQATLSIFQSIFIRMGLYDEIYAGRSTFFVELMETSSILSNGSSRSLVIIDELGRGTGTHDGSAIAYAVLEYLVQQMKCITLFVTHYPVVAQLEQIIPQHVANYHMGYLLDSDDNGRIEEDSLIFLYLVTRGKCPKSFGLNVARLAGVANCIVDKAKMKSEQFLREADFQRVDIFEFQNIFLQLTA